MQKLEDRTALFILKNLKENLIHPGAGRCSTGSLFRPPSTITHTFACGNAKATI
jgi:hypothetical protein